MGKKKKKNKQKEKDAFDFTIDFPVDQVMTYENNNGRIHRRDAKRQAKERKKIKKQYRKEMQKEKQLKNVKNYKGWHRLSVVGASGVDKLSLFTKLGEYVEVQFQPLGFHQIGTCSSFYLEANAPAAL